MRYYLRTLGSVSLLGENEALTGRVTQRRRLALLVLLAGAGESGLTRDKLIAYLWPERSTEQCRHALSQALYQIRQQLGQDAVQAGVDDLRLNPQVVTSDLAELESASAAGESGRVIELYRGPFLDGFFISGAPEFERWAEEKRADLERRYAEALERVADEAAGAGDPAGAVEAWRLRAAADPLDSAVARALMEALLAAGDRPGAIRHAEAHAAALQRELDTAPDPAVSELAARLREEAAQDAATGADGSLLGRVREASAPDLTTASASPPRLPDPDVAAAEHARARDRGPWAHVPAVLAPLALLSVLGAGALLHFGSGGESVPRPVVVASVDGSDPALALAVYEALTAELHSSPDVRVLPEAQVRATLPLMHLPSDAPVHAELARAIAQRRGVPAVVVATVQPLGTGAQLVARLVDARTGEVLAAVSRHPRTQEEVVVAVTSLADELRQRITGTALGMESELPAVSTTSLPALQSYALARQAVGRDDREAAIYHAEAALVHDTLFAMGHYLLGDLYWYLDRNRRAQHHIRRAQELSTGLHARERLVVRARFEELVEDRPDSALHYWRLLTASYPEEALGWEGKRWSYRAMANTDAMAAAAESAFVRDPDLVPYYGLDRIAVLARGEDSTAVLDFAHSLAPQGVRLVSYARVTWAMAWGEWSVVLLTPGPIGRFHAHQAHVAEGRLEEARAVLDELRGQPPWMQWLPRALLLQARAEATEPGGSRDAAGALARETLAWIRAADLSPPAYARLAERLADVGARIGDEGLVQDARALLLEQDGGRRLRSFVAGLQAIEAFAAFLSGDHETAARHAAETRGTIYFARSTATLILLEADARAASGDHAAAYSLRRLVVEPGSFPDGDPETLAILRTQTARLSGLPPPRARPAEASAGWSGPAHDGGAR